MPHPACMSKVRRPSRDGEGATRSRWPRLPRYGEIPSLGRNERHEPTVVIVLANDVAVAWVSIMCGGHLYLSLMNFISPRTKAAYIFPDDTIVRETMWSTTRVQLHDSSVRCPYVSALQSWQAFHQQPAHQPTHMPGSHGMSTCRQPKCRARLSRTQQL